MASGKNILKTAQVVRRFAFDEWGGTENVVWNSAAALQSKGVTADILATSALAVRGDERRDGILVRRFDYFYPYFPLSGRDIADLDKKGGSPFCHKLYRALLEGDYDLIHVHSGGRCAQIALQAARRKGVPCVFSLHGGFADVPANEMRRMLSPVRGKLHYGGIIDRLRGWRLDPVAHADAVICVGRNEQLLLHEKYPENNIVYLPNGVDVADFASPVADSAAIRRYCRIDANCRLILCVSRIDYQKNQKILLELLAREMPEHPDTHLLLIGPVTSASYCEELKAMAARYNLPGKYTLIPGLAPEDHLLRSALHEADVFILPSLHEPFGIVILEAWAAERPVISTAAGGAGLLVKNGETGLLFDPSNADELCAAYARLLHEPSLAARLAANGRRECEQYSWDAVSDRLLQLYRQLSFRKNTGAAK